MTSAQEQHTEPGLPDAAANGLGKLAVQEHLMEGKLPAVLAAGGGQLAVQGGSVHADTHGGDLKRFPEDGIPHQDVAVQLPIVIVRRASVVALAGLQGLADLHQKDGAVSAADFAFPFRGGQVREPVLQLLGGDEIDVAVRPEGENGVVIPESGGCITDGPHDGPDGILEVLKIPVPGIDMFFPIPLVHVD